MTLPDRVAVGAAAGSVLARAADVLLGANQMALVWRSAAGNTPPLALVAVPDSLSSSTANSSWYLLDSAALRAWTAVELSLILLRPGQAAIFGGQQSPSAAS